MKIYMEELTIPEEIVRDHVEYCNKIHPGFAVVKNSYLFKYPIGTIVTTTQAYPRNIIGTIFGYVFDPITKSYRAVLAIDCDVCTANIREATHKEVITYLMYSQDFDPVEERLTSYCACGPGGQPAHNSY